MAVQEAKVEDGEIEDGEVAKKLAIDFTRKHPLEHGWTLWFDNPNGGRVW